MVFWFKTVVIPNVDRHASCGVAHFYCIDGGRWEPLPFSEDLFPFEHKDPLELASEVHQLRAAQYHQLHCPNVMP